MIGRNVRKSRTSILLGVFSTQTFSGKNMIGYVTIGTNNFEESLKFYDELMSLIGEKRLWATGSMAAWGSSRNEPALCVAIPHDGNSASIGNGTMIALKVKTSEEVDLLHAKAIQLGGKDEGGPGPRGNNGFYGGYFRDLDGNKLNAYIPATRA